MIKEIKLGERTLTLNANAATPVRFKMTFGEDLLKILGASESDASSLPDTVAQLSYVMNKQALKEVSNLSFDDYLLWLEEFEDPTVFLQNSADIMSFYLQNVKTSSKAKNSKGPQSAK